MYKYTNISYYAIPHNSLLTLAQQFLVKSSEKDDKKKDILFLGCIATSRFCNVGLGQVCKWTNYF